MSMNTTRQLILEAEQRVTAAHERRDACMAAEYTAEELVLVTLGWSVHYNSPLQPVRLKDSIKPELHVTNPALDEDCLLRVRLFSLSGGAALNEEDAEEYGDHLWEVWAFPPSTTVNDVWLLQCVIDGYSHWTPMDLIDITVPDVEAVMAFTEAWGAETERCADAGLWRDRDQAARDVALLEAGEETELKIRRLPAVLTGRMPTFES